MIARAHWAGLDVAVVDTPAGATRVPAIAGTRLGFHVGRAVRASCRFAGRTHTRLQRRGDFDLVPAGTPGVWEDDRATRMMMLRISPALVRTTACELDLDPDRVELAPQFQLRDPQLEQLAWTIEAAASAAAPVSALFGDSLAVAFAAHLVAHYRTSAPRAAARAPTHGLAPAALRRVLDHIDAHLADALTLAELATIAGVGSSHFKAQFTRALGMPAHQLVVRRRVEVARGLLAGGASIADAAATVGFADASHLARWTRRLLGVAPGALRRRARR